MAENILELLNEGITARNNLINKMSDCNANLRMEIQELADFNMRLRRQLDQQNSHEKELLLYRQEIEILHLKNYELLLKLEINQPSPREDIPLASFEVPPTEPNIGEVFSAQSSTPGVKHTTVWMMQKKHRKKKAGETSGSQDGD